MATKQDKTGTHGQAVTSMVEGSLPEEFLRVSLNKKEVKMGCRLLKYRDKDTRQIIMEIPSLEVTGYGATEEKAKQMLDFCVDDYFNFLMTLSQKKLDEELARHGWKHKPFANKQFSKAFVSPKGELKNFNAVGDEIEVQTVTL